MYLTLNDIDVAQKRVLVRVDLNVPMKDGRMKDGRILDTTRIERILPTLRELASKNAKIILLSHFGRPKGPSSDLSLKPIAEALKPYLEIVFCPHYMGPEATGVVEQLQPGQAVLLENLRFNPGEESNDEEFARQLASLGDIYVNDAFSVSHRAHASVDAITHYLPSAAGRLMEAELGALEAALREPKRPLAAIVSGSKVSTKLELLNALVGRVNTLILGGGIANTFLLAQGYSIGQSLCEPTMLETAKRIAATAQASGCAIIIPQDAAVTEELTEGCHVDYVSMSNIREKQKIADVGPNTIAAIAQILESSATLVWNGPLGVFEIPPFNKGTNEIALMAAKLTQAKKLFSVAGGGETVAAITVTGVADQFSYLSTAGGAFLEWLEGKHLPGITALEEACSAKKVISAHA